MTLPFLCGPPRPFSLVLSLFERCSLQRRPSAETALTIFEVLPIVVETILELYNEWYETNRLELIKESRMMACLIHNMFNITSPAEKCRYELTLFTALWS